MISTRTFVSSPIQGITCDACTGAISSALNGLKLTTKSESVVYPKANVSIASHAANLIIETSEVLNQSSTELCQLFKKTIEEVGYRCDSVTEINPRKETIDLQEIKGEPSPSKSRLVYQKGNPYKYWYLGGFTAISGIVLLLLPIVQSFFGWASPLWFSYALAGCSTFLTFYAGKDTYREAINEMRHQRLGMNVLFTLSSLISLTVSLLALFFPGLPIQFETPLLILGPKLIGKGFQESVKNEVVAGGSFCDDIPRKIALLSEGEILNEINVASLNPKLKPVIRVYGGQKIPVDGICNTEKAFIIDPIVNAWKTSGINRDTKLSAGMVVPENVNYIDIQVIATENNSRLAVLDARKQEAHESGKQAQIQETTQSWLAYFVPLVFIISIVAGCFIGHSYGVLSGLRFGVAMLVFACPCVLGLIVPLTYMIGMNKAAQPEVGAYFQHSQALEVAAKLTAIVFDLNGTLTKGTPIVSTFVPLLAKERDNYSDPKRLLKLCAVLERKSSHPFARAICHYVDEELFDYSEMKEITFDEINDKEHRSGLKGRIGDQWVLIGNETMMRDSGIEMNAEHKSIIRKTGAGRVIFVTIDRKIRGYFVITDPVKEHTKSVIAQLRNCGKEVYLCTGETKRIATAYARELGIKIENVRANCIPAEEKSVESATSDSNKLSKQRFIQSLKNQKKHVVAMVGDGINDAIALAESHLGIAVSSQLMSDVTRASAGLVIYKDTLEPVVSAVNIAKETTAYIDRSLILNIVYNMIAMSLPFVVFFIKGVSLHPGFCAAVMTIQAGLLMLSTRAFKSAEIKAFSGDRIESMSGSPQRLLLNNSQRRDVNLVVAPDRNCEKKISSDIKPPSYKPCPAQIGLPPVTSRSSLTSPRI